MAPCRHSVHTCLVGTRRVTRLACHQPTDVGLCPLQPGPQSSDTQPVSGSLRNSEVAPPPAHSSNQRNTPPHHRDKPDKQGKGLLLLLLLLQIITLNYLQFPKWNLARVSLWYGVVCNEIILCLGGNIQMTEIINFASQPADSRIQSHNWSLQPAWASG